MDIKSFDYKSCCFTGYRPEKFSFPLSRDNKDFLEMENSLIDTVFSLAAEEGCLNFYCGMAMGFDIIAAEAVLLLKKYNKSVKLICCLPYPNHGKGFEEPWGGRFKNIIDNADKIAVLSNQYSSGCYFVRNEYMVDNSDIVVTWFDGRSGGTSATLRYAHKKRRHIINLNVEYDKYSAEQIFFEF